VMERFYTLLVVSVGLAIFLLAMINERKREFGAMRALGANLKQLRSFIFAEAVTIGGLSLVIGSVIGIGLARLLVMLLGVVFTIPAKGLAWPTLELVSFAGFVLIGMLLSTLLSTRRLGKIKVVEVLREL
jgi:ABC-type antimicrobial peptide transport system permease subunit